MKTEWSEDRVEWKTEWSGRQRGVKTEWSEDRVEWKTEGSEDRGE